MTNTISIWNEQILLHWDEMPPEDCEIPADLLRANPECVIPYWKHIGPYTRFSTKKRFFFLSLSKQNLQRLRAQFGEIDCNQGYRHIADLKIAAREMGTCYNIAHSIKNGVLETINYKVPPLGRYQDIGTNLLTFCKRVPLFADPGMGKTFMALVSTQEQFRRGLLSPGKTLICGKLATLFTGWLKDCERFTDLKPVVLWLKAGAKRKEKLIEMLSIPADIYIINHDGVRTIKEALVAKNFQKVIVDESTILKGFQGDRFTGGSFGKALLEVAHKADWRVIMTGTPAPNGPQDLWGQFYFLDPNGLILEKTIHDFRHTFMEQVFYGDRLNPNTPSSWIPKEDALERVSDLVNPLAYRVRIREHLHDLPEKTIIIRSCEMTKEQLAHYKLMENALMTQIDGENISVSISLAKLAKLRQITSGFLLDSESEAHPIADNPKLDLLDQLILEEISLEEKIVIYAQHQWEIQMLESRYKNLGTCTVYGGNPSHVNLANIDRFISDSSVKLIILHPRSAAHGITFVVSHYMVFFSISYSEEDNYQCKARIERAGQKHPMFIYYLLCNDCIDTDIYEVLQEKNINQSIIIDADIVSRVSKRLKFKSKTRKNQ